jgi:hypothetical protein
MTYEELERAGIVNTQPFGCWWGAFAVAVVLALTLLLCGGCMYKGAKITEGTDFSAGLSIPGTEGAAEISFVNYLSGFRLGAAERSGVDCEFWGTNTFSFAWGLYESRSYKHFRAKVDPCATNACETVVKTDEKK